MMYLDSSIWSMVRVPEYFDPGISGILVSTYPVQLAATSCPPAGWTLQAARQAPACLFNLTAKFNYGPSIDFEYNRNQSSILVRKHPVISLLLDHFNITGHHHLNPFDFKRSYILEIDSSINVVCCPLRDSHRHYNF